MFSIRQRTSDDLSGLISSRLYNEQSFYEAFARDIKNTRGSLVIESPFITTRRLNALTPIFRKLLKRGVKITINTRDPIEHEGLLQIQAQAGVVVLQEMGTLVLFTGGHHRKLAIIDGHILWEGSLNILSQGDSCEVMRRIDSIELTQQMLKFTKLSKWYN